MAKKILKRSGDESRDAAAEVVLHHDRKSLSDIVPPHKRNVISFIEDVEKKTKSSHAVQSEKLSVEEDFSYDDGGEKSGGWRNRRGLVVLVSGLLILGVGLYFAIFVLPSAEISIKLKASAWKFNDNISALVAGGDIPAQTLSKTTNLQLPLISTGTKLVQSRATGTIKVFNSFSSEPQTLVATTRFLTPDGKIFRLDKLITVPGAKITDGKITPASIEAAVTADKIGSEYNIPPVSRFTIPGLKGSPKYEAFYGMSEAPMVGGANGRQSYPNDSDVAAAKKEAEQKINGAVGALFAVNIPSDLTVLEGSSVFKITKSQPVLSADGSGKYVYFVEAREERVAVRRDDILNLMLDKASAELGQEYSAKTTNLKFVFKNTVAGKNGVAGGANIAVEFSGEFVRKINIEEWRTQVAGKNENDLKVLMLGNPRIESAKISLWPFWVKTVPANQRKIVLTAD